MTAPSQTLSLALSLALGAVFFLVTATTFASLGVVLPAMIGEFGWSWATAGLGFTMLALFTGVFSPIAATSLRVLGARLHYLIAGVAAFAGYLLLGMAHGVAPYLIATSLLGAAFALLANVPGTYLVGRAVEPQRRNLAIGFYLAAGGAGGVFGPFLANEIIASEAGWRGYWIGAGFIVLLLSLTIAALAGRAALLSASDDEEAAAASDGPPIWTTRAALLTPAFAIIAFALTIAYFCGVTVSTWSVAHLQKAGFTPTFAVAMFSLYSGMNAGARALGGVLVRRTGAKALLVCALLANVVGMAALANAGSAAVAIVFAAFDGFAFGMALFASTALLIDYFGLRASPALLGAVNLAATIAMVGPTIAGKAADIWGGFAPIFLVYSMAALVAAVAVLFIRQPTK